MWNGWLRIDRIWRKLYRAALELHMKVIYNNHMAASHLIGLPYVIVTIPNGGEY
jgi:DUF1680 family protein